jgi:bifunctional DNA-binding transcriptional regulator/antitoxin component of YhaV-PrlF toxin-antitoxin module
MTGMKATLTTVLTERGQVSVPAALRKKAALRTGQRLLWRQTAPGCFTVTVAAPPVRKRRAVDAIGYAERFFPDGLPGRTDDVMKTLRRGEK